ncbi:hypothetical protein [Amycolatopsis sp. NPDC051903]|uniref:hypothetical protein n=1 Tax=Amycolatopsis sp. NPDC051903 TaxID=3363936 RepID=UPI0037A45ACB
MSTDPVKAALDNLLSARRPALKALAEATGRSDKLRKEIAAAKKKLAENEDEIRAAHAAAIAAGWSTSELRAAGFSAPRKAAKTSSEVSENKASDDEAGAAHAAAAGGERAPQTDAATSSSAADDAPSAGGVDAA